MKHIFIAMLMVLGTALQAQTFDFSCDPVTYSNSFNFDGSQSTISTYPEGGGGNLDFFISGYSGSAIVSINTVTTTVAYESNSSIYFDAEGNEVDLEPLVGHQLYFFSNGKWRWRTIKISKDNTITVFKLDVNNYPIGYSIETFGSLYDFMPTTSNNAIDFSQTPDIGDNVTQFHSRFFRTSSYGITKPQKYSASTVDYTIGGTTIHEDYFTQTNKSWYVTSENSKFNNYRINGGVYHGWVLVKNGQSVDVIAKWGTEDELVRYAVIIHSGYGWPDHQYGDSNNNLSHFDIHLHKVPKNDFDN